ncbi:hypothetical protein V6N13_069603 [Hibiscus sabdariffa]|uniref:RNase H type-1 domain-containing protein n=1 Tax=Hibiscus sabdariffa TaxID=183260 RepID=A0ABR2PGQ7_9ROSI
MLRAGPIWRAALIRKHKFCGVGRETVSEQGRRLTEEVGFATKTLARSQQRGNVGDRSIARWSTLGSGWCTLNDDGACCSTGDYASCGVVIRNSEGQWAYLLLGVWVFVKLEC